MKLQQLYKFACKYAPSREIAEDIVHDTYCHIKENMPEYINHRGYMTQAIKRRCFNYNRDNAKFSDIEEAAELSVTMDDIINFPMPKLTEYETKLLEDIIEHDFVWQQVYKKRKTSKKYTLYKMLYERDCLYKKIKQHILRTTFINNRYIRFDEI